jgi:hypothetical protein
VPTVGDIADAAHEAEIGELGAAIAGQQHVRGLDVAVHETGVVRDLQRGRDVAQDRQQLVPRQQARRADAAREAAAAHEAPSTGSGGPGRCRVEICTSRGSTARPRGALRAGTPPALRAVPSASRRSTLIATSR